jgi:FkbM family methyltransferase
MLRWKHFTKLLRSSSDAPARKIAGPRHVSARIFMSMMARHEIAAVIDVGANRGQFASRLRSRLGHQGLMISIEPQPDAFADLQQLAAADEKWSAMNLALGDINGILPLNISANSASSSILPMLGRHVQSAPHSAYVGRIDVQVRRLDSLPELRAAAAERCLLKIDAQGYEYKILQGAEGVIDRLSLIYLECALVPLYEGELLIEEMIAYLRKRNFAPVDIGRGHFDRTAWQQLQANILFAKV